MKHPECRYLYHHKRGILSLSYRNLNGHNMAFVHGRSYRYIVPYRYFHDVLGTRALSSFICKPDLFETLLAYSNPINHTLSFVRFGNIEFNIPTNDATNTEKEHDSASKK